MSHTDSSSLYIATKLSEPTIAQFTGCHLNAHLVQRSIFVGIEMCQMQRNIQSLAQRLTERFIPVGLLASQVEIAVGSVDAIACFLHP